MNDYILIATDDVAVTVVPEGMEVTETMGETINGEAIDPHTQSQKRSRPKTENTWLDEISTKAQKAVGTATQMTTTTLEVNMNRFVRFVGRMFNQVDQQIGTDSEMKLDEVVLSISISGKGEIQLLAGAEAKSSITLKFKRVEKTEAS
ncbi:MAG: hypothetical protein AB4042_14705 [Leptolyngbyaceae cyanobacterium]